ncbi:MAG: type 1 glutamine amidotransferase, partial [Frankiaceae bacterium]|nr:type 1 glutamine amidotransferase [Frankiaceae bacterium]
MARVLVVQHTAHEGLGRLQDWLPAAGVDVHPIHPYLGHRVPQSVEGDALIVLGGPMGALADEVAPWLPATRSLLATAIDDGVPTLGICLGAQLLAVAAGGSVERGALGPELGLGTVTVSQPDVLLQSGELPVVQWHFDTVTRLPQSAALLASSSRYAAQAFRVGEVAWGLQFHIEATPEMVSEWARIDADALAEEGRSAAEVVGEVAAAVGDLEAV